MTTKNENLFNLIETFDNTARIAALRGVANSSMAKCIGAIRQDIRERKRLERDAENPQVDLDVRNEQDAGLSDNREELAAAFGFDVGTSPLKQASTLHAVFDWADSELKTLAQNKYDLPLTIGQMLDYMISNAQKLDMVTAKLLAEAAGCDVETITKMHEVQNMREREQLTEAAPEIKATFNGFGTNGYEDSVEDVPALVQHQLGIKVVESLIKARENLLMRVMRSRRISELSAIPVLKDAEAKVRNWVENFETQHEDEFRLAIEAGRNVRTLDDLRA